MFSRNARLLQSPPEIWLPLASAMGTTGPSQGRFAGEERGGIGAVAGSSVESGHRGSGRI